MCVLCVNTFDHARGRTAFSFLPPKDHQRGRAGEGCLADVAFVYFLYHARSRREKHGAGEGDREGFPLRP